MKKMQYIVVGGIYTDTTFTKFKDGGNGDLYGPFDMYDQAHEMWERCSWNNVDNCNARWRIDTIGNYSYQFPMAAVTATMAVVDGENEKILLAKRASNSDAYPDIWSLPGGFLDVGTETVKQCASREIMEECNLNVAPNNWNIIGIDDKPGYDPRYTQVVNICLGLSIADVINNINEMAPNDDVQELKWVSFEDAKTMELAFNHTAIIKMIINAMGD